MPEIYGKEKKVGMTNIAKAEAVIREEARKNRGNFVMVTTIGKGTRRNPYRSAHIWEFPSRSWANRFRDAVSYRLIQRINQPKKSGINTGFYQVQIPLPR